MAENSPSGPQDHSQFIPSLGIPQSGWERVRELYQRNEQGELPEEAEFMVKSAITGAVVGMVYGGVPAARYSREQYIRQSQAEIYQHRVQAVRAAQNAAFRGFIRYGFRWGWRVAAFVTIFNGVSSGLSAYRDEVAMSHYAAAGALTGGLFRMNLGLKGLIGGSVIGGLLGVPMGALVSLLQGLAKEDLLEEKRRKRHQLQEQKMKEWQERLHLGDDLIRDMQDKESATSEMEKITELLQQPRNPGHTPEE